MLKSSPYRSLWASALLVPSMSIEAWKGKLRVADIVAAIVESRWQALAKRRKGLS